MNPNGCCCASCRRAPPSPRSWRCSRPPSLTGRSCTGGSARGERSTCRRSQELGSFSERLELAPLAASAAGLDRPAHRWAQPAVRRSSPPTSCIWRGCRSGRRALGGFGCAPAARVGCAELRSRGGQVRRVPTVRRSIRNRAVRPCRSGRRCSTERSRVRAAPGMQPLQPRWQRRRPAMLVQVVACSSRGRSSPRPGRNRWRSCRAACPGPDAQVSPVAENAHHNR